MEATTANRNRLEIGGRSLTLDGYYIHWIPHVSGSPPAPGHGQTGPAHGGRIGCHSSIRRCRYGRAQAAQHAAEMARLEQIDVKDVGNLRLRVADPSTVLIAVKIRVEPKPEV